MANIVVTSISAFFSFLDRAYSFCLSDRSAGAKSTILFDAERSRDLSAGVFFLSSAEPPEAENAERYKKNRLGRG